MHHWVLVGILAGAAVFAIAAYFLPERETAIRHGAMTEEIRSTVPVVGPLVNDLGPLLNELRK